MRTSRASVVVVVAVVASLTGLRPARAQQGWGPTTAWGLQTRDPAAAANASGNAVVAWVAAWPSANNSAVFAARRPDPAGSFLAPAEVSGGTTPPALPHAAVTSAGDSLVVWQQALGSESRVWLAEYQSNGVAWSAPVELSPSGASATAPRVMACGDTATVLWISGGLVQARRRTGSMPWGAVVTLDAVGGAEAPLAVVASAACDVTVAWRRQPSTVQIVSAVAPGGTGAWSAVAAVSQPGEDPSAIVLTVAPDGAVTAGWRARYPDHDDARAARRVGGAWSAPVTLEVTPGRISSIGVTADPSGVVTSAWGVFVRADSSRAPLSVSRLDPTASSWSPVELVEPIERLLRTEPPGKIVLAADRTGTVTLAYGFYRDFDMPSVQTLRFDPFARQWRRSASFVGEPAELVSLPGYGVLFAWLGVIQFGGPAPAVAVIWNAAPAAPSIASTTPADGLVSLEVSLRDSDTAFRPRAYDYSLDGGATWTARIPAPPMMPLRIDGLTNGVTYRIALRDVNRAGAGAASSVVDVTPVAATPRAPTYFRVAARTASSVTFEWRDDNPAPPDGFAIEGGVLPGQTLASIAVAGTARSLEVVLRPGIYSARIHAVRTGVRSAASRELTFGLGTSLPPAAPTGLLGLTDGSSVALSWATAVEGGTASALRLDVTGSLQTSALLPPGETFRAVAVPPGSYFVRLTALNSAGASPPSNGVLLDVPASCGGVPGPPEDLRVTASGGRVRVAWAPPDTGPAVARYDVAVSGTYTGTVSVVAREVSALASGTFIIRVSAVNSCGSSVTTAPQSVVAP